MPRGRGVKRQTSTKTSTPTEASTAAKAPDGLTVGVDALLEAGSDAAFRDFVADLFAASSSMQSIRRSLARATDLSGSEIAMLLAIRRLAPDGSVGIRAIAEHLHVAGPHVTTEVGKLVEAGLVVKETRASDGRAVDIALTTAGQTRLQQLTPLVRAANDVLFAGMTEIEMQHVHRFLRRIVASSLEATGQVDAVAADLAR